MMQFIQWLIYGFNAPDVALFVTRATVGIFFAISGFNKLFNPARHQSLVNNLTGNHIPDVKLMQWFVPFWEFTGGLMLAIGLATVFSAGVLLIICLVACECESAKRVEAYKPINAGDKVADYLYLQEILYMALLAVNVLAGSGKYSVDYFIINI
jgi:putative oxidoreductase